MKPLVQVAKRPWVMYLNAPIAAATLLLIPLSFALGWAAPIQLFVMLAAVLLPLISIITHFGFHLHVYADEIRVKNAFTKEQVFSFAQLSKCNVTYRKNAAVHAIRLHMGDHFVYLESTVDTNLDALAGCIAARCPQLVGGT